MRFGHKIYFDWILQKYPEAAKYVWEHTGNKIEAFENREDQYWSIMGKRIPSISNPSFFPWLRGALIRHLGCFKKVKNKEKEGSRTREASMNPVDLWYNTNPRLRGFMDNYWERNRHLIPEGRLREDMAHLYRDCVVSEKLQCLSVLSAMKLILS